ncbi:hypothetical protein ACFSKN_07395 [Mariniflexile gromovii]|uniref:Lipoprotein n=1 Tax=Mariniflexile gromovii TaxID=362523 RepID=A0ABS4BQG8_9FLAO|nr:hypothetical protein [Mariniflexile gromovii]MBP0902829.1 hypothetical protein [Mariniflexile gromovii]
MQLFKSFIYLFFIGLVLASFSQCVSANKLQTDSPLKIGDVYYQEDGAHVSIVIPITSNPNNIVLDNVYFHGKESQLEFVNDKVYIGRFQPKNTSKSNIIMSNEPYAEYGNKVPEIPRKPRFQLKEDECMVSYKQGKGITYFKIDKIKKK